VPVVLGRRNLVGRERGSGIEEVIVLKDSIANR
jgi:hypothetical protein